MLTGATTATPGRSTRLPLSAIRVRTRCSRCRSSSSTPTCPSLRTHTRATPGRTSTPAKTPCSPPAVDRRLVPTGVALALPPGYAGFVLPRSGLALRHGVTCLNTPGLIDAGYRDELRVLLSTPTLRLPTRSGEVTASPSSSSRPVEEAKFVRDGQGELPESSRGLGGFGHTGRYGTGPRGRPIALMERLSGLDASFLALETPR